MELKTIPGKDLIPSEWNPRSKFDEEKLHLLKKSMDGIGLVEPLVVRPGDNGKYLITAGERRWRSNPESDFVCIIRKENDLRAKISCLVENYVRENIDDADHEKFISDIFKEGLKGKEWNTYPEMEGKTGIPCSLIQDNNIAHKDRVQLGIPTIVSTNDIMETRVLKEKPKLRKKVLIRRADGKISGAGHVVLKWANELNKLPEEKALEVVNIAKDFDDVKIAVEIHEGTREPGMFLNGKISKLVSIKMRCEEIVNITPTYINAITNIKEREQSIDLLKGAYNHLHKLLIALNEIEVIKHE